MADCAESVERSQQKKNDLICVACVSVIQSFLCSRGFKPRRWASPQLLCGGKGERLALRPCVELTRDRDLSPGTAKLLPPPPLLLLPPILLLLLLVLPSFFGVAAADPDREFVLGRGETSLDCLCNAVLKSVEETAGAKSTTTVLKIGPCPV